MAQWSLADEVRYWGESGSDLLSASISHFDPERSYQRARARGDRLVHTLDTIEGDLTALKIEKAKVDGERKAVEADLGPVRYLATLIGATDDATMRGFVLIVALLLDPAAVLLLLAATHRGRS